MAQGALASDSWWMSKSRVQPRYQKKEPEQPPRAHTGMQIQLWVQAFSQRQLGGTLSSRKAEVLGGHLIPPAECSPAPPQPGGTGTSLEQVLFAGPSTQLLKRMPQKLRNASRPQMGCGILSSVKKGKKNNIENTGPGLQGFDYSKIWKSEHCPVHRK